MRRRTIIHRLIYVPFLSTVVWYSKPSRSINHTKNPSITWHLPEWKTTYFNPGILIFRISIYLIMNSKSNLNTNIWCICLALRTYLCIRTRTHWQEVMNLACCVVVVSLLCNTCIYSSHFVLRDFSYNIWIGCMWQIKWHQVEVDRS